MDLCIDVGNTRIAVGFYDNSILVCKDYMDTHQEACLGDVFISLLYNNYINLKSIENVIYSSVVPFVDEELLPVLNNYFIDKVHILKDCVINLDVNIAPNEVIGDDLLADLFALKVKYGYPSIVVDLGTASKILVLNKDCIFEHCLIIPGLNIQINSLSDKTALLPEIKLERPSSYLANNTFDAINSGVILGHEEMIKGLIKQIENELGYETNHILTGGNATLMNLDNLYDFVYDEDLCLDGLEAILKENLKYEN